MTKIYNYGNYSGSGSKFWVQSLKVVEIVKTFMLIFDIFSMCYILASFNHLNPEP